MEIVQSITVILVIFISLIVMDFIWLGIITKQFIITQFSTLIKVEDGNIKINLIFGLLAWLAIALGVFFFAVLPSENLSKTILMAALFGFIAYSIYDFTNLTFIKGYPLTFALVDILWGTFLCSVISIAGYFTKSLF